MADVITQARREIESRLRELEPLVAEIERLRSALDALDAADGGGRGTRRRRTTSTSTAGGRRRARPGENKRKILGAIKRSPGITAAQVAEQTGLPKPSVASSVSKLKRDGVLESAGGSGLRVADTQPESSVST